MKLKHSLVIFIGMILLSSCEQFNLEPENNLYGVAIPSEVNFELPSALNSEETLKNFKVISGKGIHNYLRNFVFIGSEVLGIINSSYQRIAAIDVEGLSEFSYTGVDGNTKHVSIKESIDIENVQWDYYMEIYSDDFSNLALQVFWNDGSTEQRVIVKPNQLNKYKMQAHPEAMLTIEYLDEVHAGNYDKSIYIGISGLTISEQNPFAPDNMKLFFGVNNQIIDFVGSSNNPNASLYNTNAKGKNWSFRGKADLTKNLAMLELALPGTNIENIENVMTEYSLKNVILQELRAEYSYNGFTDTEILADNNIDVSTIGSPSWFNSEGFQSSGENIPAEYAHLSEFNNLTPFVPLEVKEYVVEFISFLE